jgi:hypothetical protein
VRKCLEHGEEGKETSHQATDSGVVGGSASELRGGRAGGVGSDVASRPSSLRLSIRDLRDNEARGGHGGSSLGLSIRDLRDNGARGGHGGSSLGLSIRDLRNNGARGGLRSGGLGLSVGDLRDDRCAGLWGSSLRLSVADLGDDRCGRTRRGSLRLPVRDLGNAWWLGDLRLAIANLRSSTAGSWYSYNVDWDTLSTGALAV